MISGFRPEADENCTPLGYYTESNSSFLCFADCASWYDPCK